MTENYSRPDNQILSALPQSEFQRLAPHLKTIEIASGDVLHEPYEPIREVYFPTRAMISLVSIMEDGSMTEIGLVGKEGMVGLPIVLGGKTAMSEAIVQISGTAVSLDADILHGEFQRGEELQRLLLLYTQALITQISQTAVCNCKHVVEKRLARWLLTARDCIQQEQFYLTHEFISIMLGVRRSSVTVAAGILQQGGAIAYRRGKITILNRDLLIKNACECYGLVQSEYQRLLGEGIGDREYSSPFPHQFD